MRRARSPRLVRCAAGRKLVGRAGADGTIRNPDPSDAAHGYGGLVPVSSTVPASPAAADVLPHGRQLAVTWGIPDQFGGMTSALLHRSRAFVRCAGREVDVVTLDTRPDYAELRARLEHDGELVRGIRLLNLYEDLRAATPPAGPIRHRLLQPETDGVATTTAPDGSELRVHSIGRRPVLVEHVRSDGTVAVRDERSRAAGPERLITAFDDGGAPVRQWTSPWACYADWLDRLIGGERTFAITDSKTAARFMARYRRPNLVSLHVVHNSHLVGTERPLGRLRPSRREVFTHLERFDGVVFLTPRQRDDAAALLSDPGNLAVVPNGLDPAPDAAAWPADRDVAAGVVVAGLTPRKRIGHAVSIAGECRARGVPATLRVFGDGPDAPALRARVADAGLDEAVEFLGHRPRAADAFLHASWTLITSTAEGAPLVLAEAMARGCIPIAYDIPYGPADLIVDGVNGYLVPEGDRSAAAAAIARFAALTPEERDAMRRAARAAAARHDDDRIVAEWGRVQRAAATRRERPEPPLDVSLERLRLLERRGRVRAKVWVRGVPSGATVVIRLRNRENGVLLQTRVQPGSTGLGRRGRQRGRSRSSEPARDRVRDEWRLDEHATSVLGTGHPLTCTIAVELENSRVELPAVRRAPDPRALPLRALGRLRRLVRAAGDR